MPINGVEVEAQKEYIKWNPLAINIGQEAWSLNHLLPSFNYTLFGTAMALHKPLLTFLSLERKGVRIERKELTVAEYNIAVLDSCFGPLIKWMNEVWNDEFIQFFSATKRSVTE